MFMVSSCKSWEALVQKGPDCPTRALYHVTLLYLSKNKRPVFVQNSANYTWIPQLPNSPTVVEESPVYICEIYFLMVCAYYYFFKINVLKNDIFLITFSHTSPFKPDPHSLVIQSPYFLLRVWQAHCFQQYIYIYFFS